ncbi:unnamed protein product, partial [Mesorhabditis belari]|uniref:Domain of unknown function DB domain-containing protein n=1 Tax=Mesorhabditis belari TaxID=2138241 RepID=A0AAF3EZD1_9BILA
MLIFLTISFFFLLQFVHCTPNDKLRECCETLPGIDQECAQKFCDFHNINSLMVVPFISMCGPRGDTGKQVWKCLSSKHDHTQCCRNQGVLPFCLPFCKADTTVPNDLPKYGICIQEFEKYRKCFRTYIQHNGAYHENYLDGDEE